MVMLKPALDAVLSTPSNSAITIEGNANSLPEAPKLKVVPAPVFLEEEISYDEDGRPFRAATQVEIDVDDEVPSS